MMCKPITQHDAHIQPPYTAQTISLTYLLSHLSHPSTAQGISADIVQKVGQSPTAGTGGHHEIGQEDVLFSDKDGDTPDVTLVCDDSWPTTMLTRESDSVQACTGDTLE